MRSTPAKRQQVDQRLSVRWHEGVEVDDLADQLGDTIRNTSGDHAAVAMADEDEVAQLLALDDAEHVPDVHLQIDRRIRQMLTLA